MEHPATTPPAKQEGKRPSDADLLGYLTNTDGMLDDAAAAAPQALVVDQLRAASLARQSPA
jgi:hypothetical protein